MASRTAIEDALKRLAPRIRRHEATSIVDHAMDNPGLRAGSPEEAAWLSLVAYVRHVLTDYDALLAEGYDVDSARAFVAGDMEAVLRNWGVRRRLAGREAG